jgi:predicted metal-binding membrane protein
LGAVTLSPATAKPPLVRVSELGMVQVQLLGAVQVRSTAPANVFTEETLMFVDALLPEVTGMIVVFAISEKSASEFPIETTAVEGLSREPEAGTY